MMAYEQFDVVVVPFSCTVLYPFTASEFTFPHSQRQELDYPDSE